MTVSIIDKEAKILCQTEDCTVLPEKDAIIHLKTPLENGGYTETRYKVISIDWYFNTRNKTLHGVQMPTTKVDVEITVEYTPFDSYNWQ